MDRNVMRIEGDTYSGFVGPFLPRFVQDVLRDLGTVLSLVLTSAMKGTWPVESHDGCQSFLKCSNRQHKGSLWPA
jgi:hypothetical protein